MSLLASPGFESRGQGRWPAAGHQSDDHRHRCVGGLCRRVPGAVSHTEPERKRHQERRPGSHRRHHGAVRGHPEVPQRLRDRVLQRQGCPCWCIDRVEVARLVRFIILLLASPRGEAFVFKFLAEGACYTLPTLSRSRIFDLGPF
jgi:hypothetical protein